MNNIPLYGRIVASFAKPLARGLCEPDTNLATVLNTLTWLTDVKQG